jgi:primase-polymerase (primpol)-like protein
MPHLYKKIPAILKERPNWVVWGLGGAPPKTPFNPESVLSGKLYAAKAGVRETWSN